MNIKEYLLRAAVYTGQLPAKDCRLLDHCANTIAPLFDFKVIARLALIQALVIHVVSYLLRAADYLSIAQIR